MPKNPGVIEEAFASRYSNKPQLLCVFSGFNGHDPRGHGSSWNSIRELIQIDIPKRETKKDPHDLTYSVQC